MKKFNYFFGIMIIFLLSVPFNLSLDDTGNLPILSISTLLFIFIEIIIGLILFFFYYIRKNKTILIFSILYFIFFAIENFKYLNIFSVIISFLMLLLLIQYEV